jgi:hypothetical protein
LSELFDYTFDDVRAYESDSSRETYRQPKGCLQFATEIINKFIVRGNYSLMQWMLNLRAYGLKIHYNTTSRDHVE